MKKIYTKLLIGVLFVLGTVGANAQIGVTVSGTAVTNPALAASYTSLANALTALNGITSYTTNGTIVFILDAGTSETAPTTGLTIGSGSLNPLLSATNTVTIVKAGGTVTLNAGTGVAITPTTATPDCILKLSGADWITIDGLTFTDGNSASATAAMELGLGMFKLSTTDGCQNNTIQNCTFNMQRISNGGGTAPLVDGSVGIGIYNSLASAATTVVTPASALGANSNNKIYSNTINNGNIGIAIIGYAAATPFTLADQNNDIGGTALSTGNNILNFGGGTAATNPAAGIRTLAQYGLNVQYNTVNNNNGTGVNHVSTLRGIYLNTATSANATVSNNTVTIKGGGTTSQVSCIENVSGGTAAGNTISITNNTVTGDYLTATTGAFYGIYNTASAANINIQSNTVSNITYSDAALAGSGSVYLIYNTGAATNVNVLSNTVNNISRTGTTGATTIGIYLSSGTNQTVNTNTVSNLSINGTGTASTLYGIQTNGTTVVNNSNNVFNLSCLKTTGTSALYGIYNFGSPTNENFNDNQVYNLTHAGTGTTYGIYTFTATGTRTVSGNLVHTISSAGTPVAGIAQGSSSPNVFKNKIYNISSSSTGTALVSGIIVSSLGTTGTANIYNNLIGGLTAPSASSTTDAVRGINITATSTTTNIYVYYNTVYLTGTSSGVDFSGSAMYHTYSATAANANLVMQNNIFVNNIVAKGTGRASAFRRSAATDLGNYSTTSNNNLFYGSTIYFDGTNTDVTLAAFKARVAPRETLSVSENPTFVSTTGSDPNFLHINTAVPTQMESGGTPVSTPIAITTDYDLDARNATTPDIGADEFAGTVAVPMTYTSSTTDQLTGYAYAGNINQSIIRIKVVATGATNPLSLTSFTLNANGTTNIADINAATAKVYYTGSSTTFSTGTLFGGTIPTIANFVVNGTQVLSEGDNYFWLAYDITAGATSGNLIDGEAIDLTVGGTPYTPTVTAPAGNKIILGPMAGNYNVGTGQTFPNFVTLTQAITDLNARGVSAAVTFTLTNNSGTPYNSANGETFPLTINQVTGASAVNTISIFPGAGLAPIITGSSASAIFKLNGADYITIDGSNSGGTDRSLTISNTSTATATTAIWISSLGTGLGATDNTVKNCIIETGTISLTTYGIYIAGATISTSGTGAENNNITIQNNRIRKATYGIYARGVATTGELTGLNITQNTIGSDLAAEYITDYGTNVQSAIAPNISLNEVYNIIANNSKYGIWMGTNISNAVISRNNVHGFGYTNTTAYVTHGIYFSSATGASNNQIDNNIIYDLRSYGSTTTTTGPIGIRIVGGDGYKIYFNTVSITDAIGSATASVVSNGLMVSTASTNMNIRNNIFYNARTGGTTPKNYAIYTVTGTTFTNIDFNNYFSNGAALGFIGAEVANLAALQAATTQDGNSIATDPLLNSPTNMIPGIGSPVVGAGDNSTGITIDYLGVTRNDPPTIGAYEDAADLTGPIITYTPLINTLCTTDRTLAPVTITDINGVNTTAGTRPRLYYRKSTNADTYVDNTNATDGWKYVEATGAGGSPFSFTTNYSLVFGGVAAGDSITYFVTAQDLVATPNVGINSGTFAATPASVNLTAAAFPLTGTVNGYRILTGGLSGSVNVGPGETYTTLSAAAGLFSAINAGGLTGNLTANITGNIAIEDGANALNAITYGCAGLYTLTIKPATGVTAVVSGTSAGAIIKLNGADNVIIDGSNNGSSSRDLTIENISSGTNTAAIWVSSLGTGAGATNNTIKNANIKAGSNSVTSTFGIHVGGTTISTTGTGDDNDNLAIQNNSISKAYYGIYARATATGVNNTLTISNNSIGSATATDYIGFRGMQIYYADGASINGNTIFNIINSVSNLRAMELVTGFVNSTVSKNKIYEISYTATSNSGGKGITINTGSAASNVTFSNNVIYGLKGHGSSTATNNSWGIMLEGGGGYNIYFNSVNLSDNRSSTASVDIHGAMYVAAAVTGIDLRNNVLVSTAAAGNAAGKTYALYSLAANTAFTTINHNDYWATGTNRFAGFIASTDRITLTDMQAGFGQNANSLVADPLFNSSTDLRPLPGSPIVSAGDNSTGITDDYLGTARGNPPTMGAYETAVDATGPIITYTLIPNTLCTTDRTLSPVTITDAGSGVNTTAGTRPRLYYKKASNVANTFNDNTNLTDGWKYVEATGAGGSPFSFTTDYSLLFGGAPAGGETIQYFVVAQDLAATPNVSINSGTFAATPVSVVLTAAAFPITGTVNQYSLIAGGISTDKTIGATGADYTSLTGATGLFAAINAAGLTNNITVTILDASVIESGATVLNNINYGCAGSYTLTIKPAVGVTTVLSGSSPTPLIDLSGADNVTIDGSNNGSSSKDLTITNTNTSGAVIRFINDATGNTIKNTILNGVSTATTNGIITFSTTTGITGNDDNNIQNNDIAAGATANAYGIYNSGTILTSALKNSGNQITGNNIFNFSNTGIFDAGGSAGTVYTGNQIYGVNTQTTSLTGFRPSSTTIEGVTFTHNRIYDLKTTGTGTVYGIHLFDIIGNVLYPGEISNNMIALDAVTPLTMRGIYDQSTIGEYFNVYYNSVSLSGTVAGASNSEAYYWSIASTSTVKNNIFVNTRNGGTGKHYAIRTNTTLANISSDYNDIYAGGGTGNVFGYDGVADRANLAAWQAATLKDVNSISVQPNFVSTTDLHLLPNNCGLDGYGTPIAGITTDYDLQTRDVTTPDMGADEFTATYGTTLAGVVGSPVCDNKTVSATGTTYATSVCDLIAKVLPSGASPVSDKIDVCVTLDGTQQTFNNEPYVQRHHDLAPVTNPTTSTATISLYFTDAEFVAYNTNNPSWPQLPTAAGGGSTDPNRANLQVTEFKGTPTTTPSQPGFYSLTTWAVINPVDANITWNTSYWTVTFNITGFGGFYIHTNGFGSPLPITINYFTGVKQGSDHLLNWKVTCNSTPRATMILERSADSRNFTPINTVTADAVRCNSPFSYTDVQPLPGMNYYRLKMIDDNGAVSYSGIVALLNAVKGFEIISIAPNPVTNGNFKLNVTSANAATMQVIITDMQGRMVSRQSIPVVAGFSSIPMNVTNLAAGTYSIQAIFAGEPSKLIRFVKQ